MTLYVLAMFSEVPYSNLQYVATHIHNHSTEYPQVKLHECVHCYFAFKKVCWSNRLDIFQSHRIEALMCGIVAQWETALENIEQAAQANNQSAKYIVAAAQLNRHAIYQHYASHMQDLADRMPEDQVRQADIEGMIRRTFGFEDGPLSDSPGNI